MKKLLLTLLLVVAFSAHAQVGIGTTTPDASSILELDSSTQGMLTPRMLESERDAIASPATGLLIYQTNNTPGFYYYNGTIWTPFGGADTDWTVSGNDMYNANTGNVGVGNTAPTAKFHIAGTTTPSSPGGTVELLNEDFTGYSVTQNHTSDASCGETDGWEVSSTGNSTYGIKCSSCTGDFLYIDSSDASLCDQNAIAIIPIGIPTTTSIDISFDYEFVAYGGSYLKAYLYKETAPSGQVGGVLNVTTDTDTSFANTVTVEAGNTYSLRFEYVGTYAYGATIDNVLVTENGGIATPGSYAFRLEDGNQQAGHVLTSDANGNATWEAAAGGGTDNQTLSISGDQLTISNGNTVTIPTGGGGGNSANNGLSLSGSNVQLGGTLIKDTTINLDYDLTFATGAGAFPGDVIFTGNSRTVLETNLEDDYINFGGGYPSVDADDGSGFTDSGNSGYTKDFVAGFYNGSSGGSAVALGSIEYIVDGTSELFVETSAFSPMDNKGADLGAGSAFQSGPQRFWDDVWVDDVVTEGGNTYSRISSKSTKKRRGLNELMSLEPIMFRENTYRIGSRNTTSAESDIKLGFTTSNVLEVIPEAVKTSDWMVLEEGKDPVKVKIDNPNGIMYNQIIPVTVKAIQEQQEQIEDLKSEVAELKKLVNRLISNKN